MGSGEGGFGRGGFGNVGSLRKFGVPIMIECSSAGCGKALNRKQNTEFRILISHCEPRESLSFVRACTTADSDSRE
jgi:hypothetical protein